MTEVLRDVVAGAIDIDYDSTYENAIVEAMSRLEEMGDLVDGELPVIETQGPVLGLGHGLHGAAAWSCVNRV